MEKKNPIKLVGLKVNDDTLNGERSLENILLAIRPYIVNNQYVIGKDIQYCHKPHYHIHFVSTIKSDSISKQFERLHKKGEMKFKLNNENEKCNKLYDNTKNYPIEQWLAYPLKEIIVEDNSNIDLKDNIRLLLDKKKGTWAESKIKVQKKKELKDKRDNICKYIDNNYTSYSQHKGYDFSHHSKLEVIELLICRYYKFEIKALPPSYKYVKHLRVYYLSIFEREKKFSNDEEFDELYIYEYLKNNN